MTGHVWLIASHAFVATVALLVGAFQLARRRRGDRLHRRVGRSWVFAMLFVATSSFAIRDLRSGQLSLLHVLSAVTLVTVTLGVVHARRGNIAAHRGMMRGSWLGLVGAFIGAVAVPDRAIPTFVLSAPLGALAAAAAAVLSAAAVVGLGNLGLPGLRKRVGTWWPSGHQPVPKQPVDQHVDHEPANRQGGADSVVYHR